MVGQKIGKTDGWMSNIQSSLRPTSFWHFPKKVYLIPGWFQADMAWESWSHAEGPIWGFQAAHCGLHCALGGSLGINITSFPLHCSLWNIQSEKHFSAYFQMLWNYLYPILTHFYWIKSFMSLEYKRREIWENKVKNTAKLSYI